MHMFAIGLVENPVPTVSFAPLIPVDMLVTRLA